MSFPVTFYKNGSATNVVDKNITSIITLNGVLRKSSSITDPVIVFDINDFGTFINNANYIFIQSFGRYYYITNIISIHQSLWEVHCHVDVLMSYKDDIRAQNAIISRQEGLYNLYLDDGVFMAYQNPLVQTKTFSNPTPFETQEFVLIVAGS